MYNKNIFILILNLISIIGFIFIFIGIYITYLYHKSFIFSIIITSVLLISSIIYFIFNYLYNKNKAKNELIPLKNKLEELLNQKETKNDH